MSIVTPKQVKESLDQLSLIIDKYNTQIKSLEGSVKSENANLSKNISTTESRLLNAIQTMHKTHTIVEKKSEKTIYNLSNKLDQANVWLKILIVAVILLLGIVLGLSIKKAPIYQGVMYDNNKNPVGQNYYLIEYKK